jgi:hypothetical protein
MKEFNIKDVKIEKIAFFDTKKDGSPLITRDGKPFKKVLIDIDPYSIEDLEFTGKLSMLDFDGVADNWKVGDTITGKIINDGEYWNFQVPKVDLRTRVAELEKENAELKKKLAEKDDVITDEDLPF